MGADGLRSYHIANESVLLHVLEKGERRTDKPSLLVINGLWEPAERAIPLLSGLSGHVVTFSFRGRGLSSTPDTGYGLDDHLSDIAAVVRHCELRDYVVLGFSRGASYALGWAIRHQRELHKLILVDQAPLHRSLTPEAVNFWIGLTYQQVPILNYMRREALEGLGREAEWVDYSPDLAELSLPVILFAGGRREGDIPSDLTEDILRLYGEKVADLTVKSFPQAGHMIPDEATEAYIREIANCLITETTG